MKSKFNWILTLMFFVVQIGFAQTKTVTGVVKDVDGFPVPGASIIVVGTQRGISADDDGAYSIDVEAGEQLEVSMIGYMPKVVTVGKSNLLNVTLAYDTGEELTTIVLDSYRSVSKPKSATSSSTVDSKDIEGKPNSSFVQTLQSKVPGLNISTGSGQPGTNNTSVILRGVGSINGNIEPLFLIDGVPQNAQFFSSLNPNDIENVTVLKDAGATSIYGNRGANGVIVVTTKGASYESDLQVRYIGASKVSVLQDNKYRLMDAGDLIALERAKGIDWNRRGKVQALRGNTNWLNYFFQPAIGFNHTVSISGGTKNLATYTSAGYSDEKGILKGTDFKRFSFRSNVNGRSNDRKLTYSTNFSANYSKSTFATSIGTGGINQNVVLGALQGVPYLYPEMIDRVKGREWTLDDFQELRSNPLIDNKTLKLAPLLLVDKLNNYTSKDDQLKIVARGQVDYKLTEGLSAGTSLGIDYANASSEFMDSPYSFNAWYFSDWYFPQENKPNQEFFGSASESNSTVAQLNAVTNLKWEKVINKDHEFKVGAFLEYLKGHAKSNGLAQNGLYPVFATPGTSSGWISFVDDGKNYYLPSVSSSKRTAGLFSYFGTFDYDYKTKYGLSATVRRDASYRFAGSNRWGTFWSVSGRWNIDREEFMKNSSFKVLKLRASYGTSGNQDILGTGLFGASSLFRDRYGIGAGYNNELSIGLIGLSNPNLSWEVITQANVGVDWEVWNSRFRGSLDVYQKVTTDLFQEKPLSSIQGQSSIRSNVGSMKNEGIEAQFAVDVVKKQDFRLTFNANGSYNKNVVLELPTDDGIVYNGGITTMREGDLIYQYFAVRYAGVNPKNGNLYFYDKDGNLTETPTNEDRVYTGKNLFPTMQGGFGLDVSYKGFFLNTLFSFATDVWRFDSDYSTLMNPTDLGVFNKSKDLSENYWTPDNKEAEMPSLTASRDYESISDRFLQDASYLRLRHITLGYDFKRENLAHLKLSGLRIFAQAENPYTWSKWRGFDAESNRISDYSQYPTPRTFSLGVEVSF